MATRLPRNRAVCEPTVRVEVAKVAEPFVRATACPKITPASRNVTVDVGRPDPDEVTAAVSVTEWLLVEGFCEDVTVVVEAAAPGGICVAKIA
jgi:hypothetical protein